MKKTQKKDGKLGQKLISITLPSRAKRQLLAHEAVNLAKQAVSTNHYPQALRILEEILQQLPGFSEAWLVLFDVMHRVGDMERLAQAAQRCLQQKPRFVPALVSLAISKKISQQHTEALLLIDKALKLDPANSELHNHKGIILKEMGRPKEALESFNRSVAIRPSATAAIWNRADLSGVLDSIEYKRCLALAKNESLNPTQRAMVYYALSRSDEAEKNFEQQFKHVEAGAKLKRQSINYNHDEEIAQIDRVSSYFPDAFPSVDTTETSQPVPIFICGLPRSGTTLVEQILSSHEAIVAGDELMDLPVACSEQLSKRGISKPFPEWIADFSDTDWQTVAARYMATTSPLQVSSFFTDKNLQNYKAIGIIRKTFPKAKIIVCRREAMDNLWGCYRQYFSDGLYFTYDQNELADIWNASNRLIMHWKKLLGEDLYIVDYEDLVDNPEVQIRKILSYIGVEWRDECLKFHENKRAIRTTSAIQVRQPLSTTRCEQWKNYEAWLAPMKSRLMF